MATSDYSDKINWQMCIYREVLAVFTMQLNSFLFQQDQLLSSITEIIKKDFQQFFSDIKILRK